MSKGDTFHYTLIRSLSRPVGDRTKHHREAHLCPYCLHPFSLKHCHQNRLPECSQHPAQRVEYPKVGHNMLKFHKIQHTFPVPFVLYTDFESFITPSGEHEPSGFCCLRVSKFPQHDHIIYTYSADNVLQQCFTHIKNEQLKLIAFSRQTFR